MKYERLIDSHLSTPKLRCPFQKDKRTVCDFFGRTSTADHILVVQVECVPAFRRTITNGDHEMVRCSRSFLGSFPAVSTPMVTSSRVMATGSVVCALQLAGLTSLFRQPRSRRCLPRPPRNRTISPVDFHLLNF